MPLSWPDTPDIVTSEDLGLTLAQVTPFTFTFTHDLQQIQYVSNIVQTDATVGTRQFRWRLFSDTGLLYWTAVGIVTQPPSNLKTYYWLQGDQSIVLGVEQFPVNIPEQLYARRGWTMVFDEVNTISAGDLQFIRFKLDVLVRTSNVIE